MRMPRQTVRVRKERQVAKEASTPPPDRPKVKVPRTSSNPDECSHAIFKYLNEKKATQVCVSCGSRRRIWFGNDNTATVSEWEHQKE